MITQQLQCAPYDYHSKWLNEEPQFKPHIALKRKLHIRENKVKVDLTWVALKEKQEKQLFKFLEVDNFDSDRFEHEREYLDDLYVSYKEFCKKAMAMLEHKELLAVPSIRDEFESFTHRLNKFRVEEDDSDDVDEELDTSSFFSEMPKESTKATDVVRDKIIVMRNDVLAKISDLQQESGHDDEIKVLHDKVIKLNHLIANCTWHEKWVWEARRIYSA